MRPLILYFAFFSWLGGAWAASDSSAIILGSKKFTESYVLAELGKHVIEERGLAVDHRQGMGGTIILWEALRQGAVAAYPDYTGTIQQEILKTPGTMSLSALRDELAKYGVGVTEHLGFNNTYAFVLKRDRAAALHLRTISEITVHPDLIFGLTHEFLGRQDGWKPLCVRLGSTPINVRGIDHSLGYVALQNGAIDLKDAYSTDAKIAKYDLVTLKDDLNFFPQYQAVFLYRLDAPPAMIRALRSLEGSLDEPTMIHLNAIAEQNSDYASAASLYFTENHGIAPLKSEDHFWWNLARWTLQHLVLVAISLFAAIIVGLPLGILASRPGWFGHAILLGTGLIQTIPSLALLALLVAVPCLGISSLTAIVALSLYGLLPIVRNTAAGIQSIPTSLRESAAILGLSTRTQLWKIYLPMSSPAILAGIKTSAIINIGTATLAALIGAGGLGEPIISGLNLNDHATILQGAVPAALLAILMQILFSALDRVLIPKGLRVKLK